MGFTPHRGLGWLDRRFESDGVPDLTPLKLLMVVNELFDLIAGVLGDSDGDGEDDIFGAESVREAVSEVEQLTDRTLDAQLGEPYVIQSEGGYFNDPKIAVPITNLPFNDDTRLVFDVPEGREDDLSEFLNILDVFGLGFETMEELEGESVPIAYIGGNASIVWEDVEGESSTGTEDDPHTEEEVEAALDDEDSNVDVQEKTISGDSDGA